MAEKSTFSSIKKGIKSALSLKDFWHTSEGFRGVLGWAAICDLLSAIPWVGLIFAFLGYASIWLTLEMKGVSAGFFNDTKRIASFSSEWIAGAFGFGIVPGISVWTYLCIADHKVELADKQRKELAAMKKNMGETQRNSKIAGEIKPVEERKKTSTYWKENKAA